MSIELHCPQCQKLIRAPDEAGGRRGKCPYCKNTVYIPAAPEQREAIAIAPVDDEEQRREEELRRESIRYVTAVDHATNAGIDAERSGIPDAASTPTVDLPAQVEAFIRAMHQSRLTDADAAAAGLKRVGRRATDHVQGLVLDQMPPTFDDIPPPLVQGFLKELLSRLG